MFTCAYCQAQFTLQARKPRSLPEQALTEPERLELLRAQLDDDHSRGVVGFSHLVKDGLHDPAQLKEGMAEWNKARAALEAGATPENVDRFFVFTKVFAEQLDDGLERRAVLETASELLPNAADRSCIHARLARLAANAGELEAAQAWLDQSDPRSTQCEADTEYRIAHARLELAFERNLNVFQTLGLRDGLVPLHARGRMLAAVFRAEAYERLGDLQSAVAELTLQAKRSATRLAAINNGKFCQRSLPLALAELERETK